MITSGGEKESAFDSGSARQISPSSHARRATRAATFCSSGKAVFALRSEYQLHRGDEPEPAHLADQRMVGDRGAQLALEERACPFRVADQVLPLDDVEVGERGRGANRVCAVGEAVGKVALGAEQHVPYPLRD